jgi:Calcineurin-like phosphoesterase superfamily domain
MKTVLISDTHNYHKRLKLPLAEMIIHCGDATDKSTLVEFTDFIDWFNQLPYKYKVFVPGNHDRVALDSTYGYPLLRQKFSKDIIFPINEYFEVEDISFFASNVFDNKFRCPKGVDVLLTHYPPWTILDEIPAFTTNNDTPYAFNLGNRHVLDSVLEIQPKYHIFGHVHEQGGCIERHKDIVFINAAVLDEDSKLARPTGILIDIIS